LTTKVIARCRIGAWHLMCNVCPAMHLRGGSVLPVLQAFVRGTGLEPTAVDPEAFTETLLARGLAPLAAHCAELHAIVPPSQARIVRASDAAARVMAARAVRELEVVLMACSTDGRRPLLLKGAATSRFYP